MSDDRPNHRGEVIFRVDAPYPNEPDVVFMDLVTGSFVRYRYETIKAMLPALQEFCKNVEAKQTPTINPELRGPLQ